MEPFSTHSGLVATMDRSNVDTDQIIPKQFLKRIERTGFGKFLFFDWRFNDDESENQQFELNQPQFAGASILVARYNFGNGSSREHAVWALADYGFKAVIAESFADIFYNNCFKNGVLPLALPAEVVEQIHQLVAGNEGYQLTVDLPNQKVTGEQFEASFEIDAFRKDCLLQGLDHIALTLQHADKIEQYESAKGFQPVAQ